MLKANCLFNLIQLNGQWTCHDNGINIIIIVKRHIFNCDDKTPINK